MSAVPPGWGGNAQIVLIYAPQRIRTKGYGAKFPVVDNDTTGGRQQNRRVEVVILEEGASAEGSSR